MITILTNIVNGRSVSADHWKLQIMKYIQVNNTVTLEQHQTADKQGLSNKGMYVLVSVIKAIVKF